MKYKHENRCLHFGAMSKSEQKCCKQALPLLFFNSQETQIYLPKQNIPK